MNKLMHRLPEETYIFISRYIIYIMYILLYVSISYVRYNQFEIPSSRLIRWKAFIKRAVVHVEFLEYPILSAETLIFFTTMTTSAEKVASVASERHISVRLVTFKNHIR